MAIQKFYKPLSLEEAVFQKDKAGGDAYYIAGGTELNSADFKKKISSVISLEKLGLSEITDNSGEIKIGAGVTIQAIVDSPLIPAPLKKAAKHIVNRNIREMATIGGNIASNKSCSNLLPILCAFDAELTILDNSGEKKISVYQYISDEKNNLIISINLNKNYFSREYNILKFSRTSNDISIITVATEIYRNDGIIKDSRIFIGGVSKHIVRMVEIEKLINGKKPMSKAEIEKAVKEIINPISDIRGSAEFKKQIGAVLIADCIYGTTSEEK